MTTILPDNILKCMRERDRKSLGKAGRTLSEIHEDNKRKAEKQIQGDIVAFLRQRDIEVLCPAFGKRTRIKAGWPDLTFSYGGIPFAWEVKTEEGVLSTEQSKLFPRLIRNGWRFSIVRSVKQAKEILDNTEEIKASLIPL